MDDLWLARLLSTRLCHDLVGPVGAVNNGLELLTDPSVGGHEDVVELIRQSAAESARRLRFFRAAYGVSGGTTTLDDAPRLAEDLFVGGRIVLDWPQVSPPAALGEREGLVPLVLNMVLCASNTLSRGGNVSVRFAPAEPGLTVRVAAAGPTVHITEATRRNLTGAGNVAALDPGTVESYLIARLAAAMGGTIAIARPAPDRAELSVILPANA